MNIPAKTLQFKVLENTYTINFPTTGQYIAIQNNKAILSSSYDALKYMGAEPLYAETLIDTAAHLTVLCPDLIKNLTRPIIDLSLLESKELVDAYIEQLRPWYNEGLNFVFKVKKEAEPIDKKTKSSSDNQG